MSLKHKIKDNFSRSAHKYNQFANIQKQVAKKLSQIANNYIQDNDTILDLGCGTGFLGDEILKNKKVKFIASDISQRMLDQVNNKQIKVNCDFENLTFKKEEFDIVVSSFSLQWSQNLLRIFKEVNRVLKKNKILIFAIPLDGSLKNIRDIGINSINKFYDHRYISNSLDIAQFDKISFEEEMIRQKFQNPLNLLSSIRNIGANLVIDNNDNKNNLLYLRKYNSFEDHWNIGYFVFKKR